VLSFVFGSLHLRPGGPVTAEQIDVLEVDQTVVIRNAGIQMFKVRGKWSSPRGTLASNFPDELATERVGLGSTNGVAHLVCGMHPGVHALGREQVGQDLAAPGQRRLHTTGSG
jgi:hypothetical protein